MSQLHGRRDDGGPWRWSRREGDATVAWWSKLPLGRLAMALGILMFAYFTAGDSLSFDGVRSDSGCYGGYGAQSDGADALTGSYCQTPTPEPCPEYAATTHSVCETTTPSPTPVYETQTPSGCDDPYDVNLTSPTVPDTSDTYVYDVTGCSADEEVKYVKFEGCWTAEDVEKVDSTAGTAEVLSDGRIRVSGLSDSDLPLTVTITFKMSLVSATERVWVWLSVGPNPSDGYTFHEGGPLCEEESLTPTPATDTPTATPATDTPTPTPTTATETPPKTNTPTATAATDTPTGTPPMTDTPTPATDTPTPTAATSTPTATPTDTPTPPVTATPSPSPSPTGSSRTQTPFPTDTAFPTPTQPPTASPTPTTPATDITLVKTDSPDPVKPGGTLTYTVTVRNLGPITAENVTVTDTMPPDVTLISATPSQGTCAGVVCNLGSLGAGKAAAIAYVAQVHLDAREVFTNAACVVSSTKDKDLTNNCDEEDTHVPTPTALEVTSTPQAPGGLPPTGGGALPGADSAGGQMLIISGVAMLAAGVVASLAARKRVPIEVEEE